MTAIKLTPAKRKFVQDFDNLTRQGREPHEYASLRDEWQIQHRTMNACRREGLLVKQGVCPKTGNPTFVINPELRDSLGLARQVMVCKILRPRKRIRKF